MHVLLVSHHFLPHVGGLEVLVHYEIEALTHAGHRVTLITSDGSGSAQTPDYPSSVEIIRVPAWHFFENRFRLPYPVFSPRLIARLWSALGKCDVVHIHGFMFHSSITAAILARLRGKPTILTDHGGIQQFDSRLKRILAWIGAHTVGRTTAWCSQRLVAYNVRITRLLEQLTWRKNAALFLPNPVDGRLFHTVTNMERAKLRRELGWDEQRPKVLFVGRLTTEKGVPQVLACAAPERYDLVFCGSGDPSILGDLPRPGVEFLPPRPQPELVKLYQAADLLVVPSKAREGFPLVVQEGLACGMKVILGYEAGFEPYRVLSGLHFCEPTAADLQRAIDAALQAPVPHDMAATLEKFCPRPEPWIRQLYAGLLDFAPLPADARS
jgi:glycosyltransferase involved in cell wall biosynthesis